MDRSDAVVKHIARQDALDVQAVLPRVSLIGLGTRNLGV
jgi:hypothetical protein